SERGAGLTPQEGGAGLMLIYRELGTAAGEGTAAQIGAKVCQAEPWTEISAPPYFVAYRGAYSDGIGIGALLPGQESWRVTAPPKDLNEGAQWTLTCDRGRTRQLRIAATRGDELTILEVGGPLALQARKTPAGFALRSITLTSRSKTMRISFTPELDLAAGSAAPVNFQIDQNGHNKIAHGSVSVETRGAAASLRWTFKAPDWAKSRLLNSTVTISDNKQCDRLTRGKSAVFEPLQTAREQPSPYSNQATVMERRETKDQVWAAIDSLPEHERETVMLFYIGGYSQREVSEFLGATAPTIRKRLFSARRRLRE